MSYIFAHGLGQTASAWDKVLERLERQPECVCPDLPELIRGKEVKQYAELYEIFSGYCDRVSGPVHLCGLSLGGILAQRIPYAELAIVENAISLSGMGAISILCRSSMDFGWHLP